MSIPTSGTYSGIDIYQAYDVTGLPIASTIADVNLLLAGSGLAIPGLLFGEISSGSDVSFNGTSISFDSNTNVPTTLDDSAVYASGPTGFGFVSGGTQYVLSNGPIAGTSTLDAFLSTLGTYYAGIGDTAALAVVQTAQLAIDTAGLGSLSFLTTAGIFDGEQYQPPCFARGTLIRTADGERPVEALVAGDRVVLARGGESEIVWVGRRRLQIDTLDRPELQRPIRIAAGALGDGLPHRDLVVSPDHALFLDGVLVPAGLLVDGSRIRQEDVETIEYFHVELASHDVILAEGAAAESYLDTGNRDTFANAPLVALRPDLSAGSDRIGTACAEMVLDGARLDRIRASLAAVAPEALRRAS